MAVTYGLHVKQAASLVNGREKDREPLEQARLMFSEESQRREACFKLQAARKVAMYMWFGLTDSRLLDTEP